MPGLIWSSKGEVLSGGAGVPDGTAGGQLLVWNAAAGEWQPQLVTPGDIGAAAAAHTHQWGDISGFVEDMGSGSGSVFYFPVGGWSNYGLGYPEMHCWRYGNAFYVVHGVVKPPMFPANIFYLYDSRLGALHELRWVCHYYTNTNETGWIRTQYVAALNGMNFSFLPGLSGLTRLSIHLVIPIP